MPSALATKLAEAVYIAMNTHRHIDRGGQHIIAHALDAAGLPDVAKYEAVVAAARELCTTLADSGEFDFGTHGRVSIALAALDKEPTDDDLLRRSAENLVRAMKEPTDD